MNCMKKTTFIILIFVIGLFTACDDLLDKSPYTSIPEEELFQDVEGAQIALYGVYDNFSKADYYGRLIYAYEGSKGPDFFVDGTGNRFEKENAYDETSSSSGAASDAWETIYAGIRMCNNILFHLEKIEGDEDEINRIKGEVLALRGLSYFDLMRLFAYPPIYSFPTGEHYQEKYKMGVPLITSMKQTDDVLVKSPSRADAKDCYDQILKDLVEAATFLDGIKAKNGTISYQAVNALLARVNLYVGNWDEVVDKGEIALNEGGRLIAYSNYKTTYYNAFNSESIWELGYTTADNLSSNSLNYLVRNPTINDPGDPDDGEIVEDLGYAGYGGNSYLQDVLTEISTDVRSYLICDNETGDDTGIRKYVGSDAHYLHNIPVVRLPEVILTIAEAYAELDNLPKAEELFNQLYTVRTGLTYTAVSKEQTIKDILKDRRKELVLEGHTYWDHFRRALPFDREAEGSVDEDKSHIDFTLPQVVYPIPQSEMESNPNIREQQNPGYAPYVTD